MATHNHAMTVEETIGSVSAFRIHNRDCNLKVLHGSGEYMLSRPTDMVEMNHGRLAISDQDNTKVLILNTTNNGGLIMEKSITHTVGEEPLQSARSMTYFNKTLFVADQRRSTIFMYRRGTCVDSVGERGKHGSLPRA